MSLYLACEYSAMENSDYYKSEDAEKYMADDSWYSVAVD